MIKTVVRTDRAPAAIGPYSQAIKAGRLVFCSGQVPLPAEAETAGASGLVSDSIEGQTRQVLDNLGEVLSAAGASWDDVVKTTIYLSDLQHFQSVNAIYAERFDQAPPARATVEVSGLPKGALIEIDAIAYVETDNE
jgi:2-iminobutanoate/2-iminopropanoate deaminase